MTKTEPKIQQKIIPSISQMKDYEHFLDSSFTYGIIMDFHIALLDDMIKAAHSNNKKIIVHMDLMKGLSNDEYGCAYACQKLKVDGVISTKGKVVEIAKKNNKLAILRLFLIDSKSLDKGIHLCNTLRPDYMEVLPGIACSIIPYIKANTEIDIMGGGLIKTVDQIDSCLNVGMCAVTISDMKLAMSYSCVSL